MRCCPTLAHTHTHTPQCHVHLRDLLWCVFTTAGCVVTRRVVVTLVVWPQARVFERESGNLVGTLRGMGHGVYSTDFHPSKPQVAVASGDGAVRLVNYLQ